MKCIHYGSAKFDKTLFNIVKNGSYLNKPYGGLWSSPVNSEYSWYDWCNGESFRLDNLTTSFEFVLENARILTINSKIDLSMLPQQMQEFIVLGTFIDFEKVALDFDAIHLTVDGLRDTHYIKDYDTPVNTVSINGLYGWDCETVLVLNDSVVRSL